MQGTLAVKDVIKTAIVEILKKYLVSEISSDYSNKKMLNLSVTEVHISRAYQILQEASVLVKEVGILKAKGE